MILDNNYRKRSTIDISIFMISAIVIMTPVIMFLYIRPSHGIIKSSISVAAILETINNGSTTHKFTNHIKSTDPTMTIHNDTQIVTDDFGDQMINKTQFVKVNSTKDQTHNNDSTTEEIYTKKLQQNDRHKVGPTILSRNKKRPIITVEENRYPNHKSDNLVSSDNDANDKVWPINNNGIFQNINRSNHAYHDYRYSTINTDIPISKRDSSDNFYNYNNKYDLSYNLNGYGYKDGEIPTEDIKWTANDNTGQTHLYDPSTSEVVEENGFGKIPYDNKLHYPVGHTFYNTPSVKLPSKNYWPSNNLDDVYDEPNFKKSIQNKLNFDNIGILVFVILGLIKLKTIGFLQFMLLLAFKFKLFMLAIFFKLSLFLKFIKFFKTLILPLFLTLLLPTLTSLFQRMGNIQSSTQLMSPGNLFSSILGNDGNSLMNGIPSGISGSGGSITRPIQIPGILGSRVSSSSSDTSLFNGNNIDEVETKTTNYSPYEIQSSHYISDKIEEPTFLNRPYSELLTSFDPSLNIIRMMFDSENCMERIACRMAAAEKIGRIPLWINWLFRDVLKFVPDEKLKAYSKAHDESNEIFTKSLITDNNYWSTWCIEHYKCNITNDTSMTNINK